MTESPPSWLSYAKEERIAKSIEMKLHSVKTTTIKGSVKLTKIPKIIRPGHKENQLNTLKT